ncbi:MAG TPA: endonuclease/exonuclease/phosphatase family protein [Bryobacteraceae bacterium]|nr:endonuclease/exonuclease/phosphatase family protein [Bryobacteraceae bacterium]
MLRRIAAVAFLLLAVLVPAASASGSPNLKIMTQNIDQGTGEGYIVAALFGAMPLPDAVDLTYQELQASHLRQRAGLIAQQIAAQKPDIVVLQEVTLWRTGPDIDHAFTPVYDQLSYLLWDMLRLGVPYVVGGVNTVDDVALAGNQIGALRLTDRNVLLVRAQFHWPPLFLSDVKSHIFSTVLDIGGLEVPSGWISATVHVGDQQFMLAGAHLESTVPGYSPATDVQVAQAQELIDTLSTVTMPVVICGDFNSDANDNPDAEDFTPSADMIRGAGYTEAWGALHAGDPGNTWPLYLDDLIPISFPAQTPFERIDLFFTRGISAVAIEQVTATAPAGFTPPYGSDHVGVWATFAMPR